MSNSELKIHHLVAVGALSSVPKIGDDEREHEKEFALRESALNSALENFVSLTGAVIEETTDGHKMTLSGISGVSLFGRSHLLNVWSQAADEAIRKA